MKTGKYIVGLTGGIGTGKSTVAALFRKLGFTIFDADILAHDLVKPGSTAFTLVIDAFGQSVVTETGELDRKKVADIVFNDPEKRKILENILHPLIIGKILEQVEQSFEKIVIIVAPLLIESGLDTECDMVIVVTASENTCIRRTIERDSTDAKEVIARIKAQLPSDLRLQRADLVITNDGSLEELEDRVRLAAGEIQLRANQ